MSRSKRRRLYREGGTSAKVDRLGPYLDRVRGLRDAAKSSYLVLGRAWTGNRPNDLLTTWGRMRAPEEAVP